MLAALGFLRSPVFTASRLLAATILAATLRSGSLRSRLGFPWRAPGRGALGLRRRPCVSTGPFLRSVLTSLHLGLRGTPLTHRLSLRRLLLLLLLLYLLLLTLSIHLLALLFGLRRRSLLHRLLRLGAGPRGIALRLGLLLDLLLPLLPLKPALGGWLLEVLLHHGIAWLIAIILRANHLLLLGGARIAAPGILPLVNR